MPLNHLIAESLQEKRIPARHTQIIPVKLSLWRILYLANKGILSENVKTLWMNFIALQINSHKTDPQNILRHHGRKI